MTSFKPRVFSGVQATGNLHLGNYLGAIKRWVELQKSYECIYCVVDMHALTVNPNPHDLIRSTREVTAAFLASVLSSMLSSINLVSINTPNWLGFLIVSPVSAG